MIAYQVDGYLRANGTWHYFESPKVDGWDRMEGQWLTLPDPLRGETRQYFTYGEMEEFNKRWRSWYVETDDSR